MNYKIKNFFTKKNTMGILISGLAGFLVISQIPAIGKPVMDFYNKLMKRG